MNVYYAMKIKYISKIYTEEKSEAGNRTGTTAIRYITASVFDS